MTVERTPPGRRAAASRQRPDEASLRPAGPRTVDRILALLDCFTPARHHLALRELSQITGLHRSTVHRLASRLCSAGYLEHDRETASYRLGLRLFELGAIVLADMELVSQARPHLEALRDLTGETTHLGVLDRGEVVYVEKFEGKHLLNLTSPVGSRRPPHCTSLGKVLLAFLDERQVGQIAEQTGLPRFTEHTIADADTLVRELRQVRLLGYAVDNEETDIGLRCVGVPIRDFTGRVVASVGISGSTSRLLPTGLPRLVGLLTEHAERISAALGWGGSGVAWSRADAPTDPLP